MIVKVCGITNLEDADVALEAGASALGFILWPKSPRYVRPDKVAEIIAALPRATTKVGVFVDEKPREIERIISNTGLDIAQLHGSETAARVPRSVRCWKAFRITPDWKPEVMSTYSTEAFLLDSPVQGTVFDWRWAKGLQHRFLLAGGLDASNVGAAIREVAPWGVDACSCLERRPGFKDHAKVRAFVAAALREVM